MTQRRRILLLIPHLAGGGAEKVTALLARELSGEKYEVHLGLVTQANPSSVALPPSVTVHALGARRVRAGALRLVHLVREIRPDVILSGMAHLSFLVLLLQPFFPRKIRILVRQNGTVSTELAFGGLPWYTSWLYRILYRRADRIICQSRAMADDLAAALRIPAEQIAILPNPIDFAGIRAAIATQAPQTVRWSGAGPHLLAIGRLAPEKGIDLLLRALVTVRRQYPSANLTILGAGPDEPVLKALCHSLGLEKCVRFAGYVQQPYDFYPGASIFVLPSRHEGLPNALLEAAAAGVPIVATPASGGLVDLLSKLDGAWLAREVSVPALASALLEALRQLHPEQRFPRSFPAAQGSGDSTSGIIGEFAFESAIAAYEGLLDATCVPSSGNHIALLIPTIDRIGGAERHVMLLAKGLLQRGWRLSVVTLSGSGGAGAAELRDAGIAFLSLGMRKGLADPRGWFRFNRWLRRERPNIVHAHLPHAAWLARWSRLFAPMPVLIDTLHSSSTGTVGRRLGYRMSRRLPDQVTAVSRSVADTHLAAKMVKPQTLTVLLNGVDVQDWRPNEATRASLRAELGVGDSFLWLAVGRLESVKDYPALLHAMTTVHPSAKLVIAGAGPLLPDLIALSSQLSLNQRVRFLGVVPDVKRWLQAADGFVLTSRWEGLPMALLEAAACALPAVATNVPGNREVILDGVTGMLAPPADSVALAAAMNKIMQLPAEERRAMGSHARQHAVEKFSLAATLDRCEELYLDLLRKKSREAEDCLPTASDTQPVSARSPGDAV